MSPVRATCAAVALVAAALLAPATAFAQASPSAYTSAARYDGFGRITGTIAPDADGAGGNAFPAVRNSYDGAGRLVRVETGTLSAWQSETVAPASWTGFTVYLTIDTSYDAAGRKLTESVREGAAGAVRTMRQYSYDADGRLECTATRMNPAIYGSLPASACTLGTAGGDGPDRITRNFYNAAGERVQLREGVGTADEGTQATWAYNLNGQIVTMIDGNGNRAALRYDGHGRQDRWTFPSATGPSSYNDATQASALASAGSVNASDYEEYGYDAAGNRISLRKRDGTILGYSYDALNRMIVKTVPERPAPHPYPLTAAQTRDVYYAYDLRGLQTEARFDSLSGEGIASHYDGFGRLASSANSMGGTARTLSHEYDRGGNRTRITHPDDVHFDYAYDGLDRPTSLTDAAQALTHLYEPWGTVSGIIRIGGASGRWTTPDGRLISLSHYDGPSFTLDTYWAFLHNPAGQIATQWGMNDAYAWTGHYAVQRPYTTNGLNQYNQAGSGAGTAAFTYDANGNLVAQTVQSVTQTYVYDIENRLVGAPGSVVLTYDPLGRLYAVSSPGTDTRFLYDRDALVAEYNAAGILQRRYVHDIGADVPAIQYEGTTVGAATRRYLLANAQGSIVAATDGSSVIQSRNTYDEYGIPGTGNAGRFQYTGQIWLAELGMYHYKARIYSPTLGRFLQTDPIGYQDQFNLYAYVGNDPMNRTDPSGLCYRNDAGTYLGVCPFSGSVEGTFVLQLLSNNPDMRAFDLEAAQAGRTVLVRFSDMTIGSPGTPSEPVVGEKVEVEREGQRRIIANVDPGDNITVYGRDQRSGRPMSRVNTREDNAVHGILGHARDAVQGRNTGELSSIEAENRNHQRNHRPFRREGDRGSESRRRNNDPY